MNALRLRWLTAAAWLCGCGGQAPLNVDGIDGRAADGLAAEAAPRADADADASAAQDAGPRPDADALAAVGDADADALATAGDAGVDAAAPADASADAAEASSPPPAYCDQGQDLLFVTAPAGFCVRQFARVGEARSLVIAPNGDLFVAAPSRTTPGGATGGPGAIVLLSDDNHDGIAEAHTFLGAATPSALEDVHGLALGGGFLYFTTQEGVWRTPYVAGQRAASGMPESLGLPAIFATGGRWTHGLARSKGGQLLASRGAYAACGAAGGSIDSIAGASLTTIASGLRNPMYMRCHARDEVCAATELGEDLTPGAREKMLMLRPGTDFGYPCCLTKGMATPTGMDMTCDGVAREDATFPLSDTPFGFDWERGAWPAPFKDAVFVALHGSAYSVPSWQGAAIVFAPTDPQTHAPVQDWQPFVGGFGPGGSILERPSDVAFSPDGRMFFADDTGGAVYWVAPVTLRAPD